MTEGLFVELSAIFASATTAVVALILGVSGLIGAVTSVELAWRL